MKHTHLCFRADLNVPCVPVYVYIYIYIYTYNFDLFCIVCVRVCVCVCVSALRCHQYTRGQVAFYVERQQEQGGSVQVASRADNIMNYGRASSWDATPTSRNMTAAREAEFNGPRSQ